MSSMVSKVPDKLTEVVFVSLLCVVFWIPFHWVSFYGCFLVGVLCQQVLMARQGLGLSYLTLNLVPPTFSLLIFLLIRFLPSFILLPKIF